MAGRILRAPLLVIHGTADPVYPIDHGVALAEMVAGASLVRVDGGGHELHEADWDTIIEAIVAHTGVSARGGDSASRAAGE